MGALFLREKTGAAQSKERGMTRVFAAGSVSGGQCPPDPTKIMRICKFAR
jgi:hypothetical protein